MNRVTMATNLYKNSNMNSMTPEKLKKGQARANSTTKGKQSGEKHMMQIMNVQPKEFKIQDKLQSTSQKSLSLIKKVYSSKREEYKSFFTYKYLKLHNQHPRWSSAKLSKIISLQWKKRMMTMIPKKKMIQKRFKPISGRKAFINQKKNMGMRYKSILKLWLTFPLETKNMWNVRGNPEMANREKMMKIKLMNDGVNQQSQINRMQFMGLRIQN